MQMYSIFEFCDQFEVRSHEAGDCVIKTGERNDEILILDKGAVEVWCDGSPIASISIRGSILGEIGVLLDRGHSADVIALTGCRFYVIPNAIETLAENPSLSNEISKALARRLARISESLAEEKKANANNGDYDRGVVLHDADHFGHYLLQSDKS